MQQVIWGPLAYVLVFIRWYRGTIVGMATAMEFLQPVPRLAEGRDLQVQYALFDVDDTLIPASTRELPSDRWGQSVQDAEAIAVIGLATARQYQKVAHILKAIPLTGPSIISNGAQIYDGINGEMIDERPLSSVQTTEVVKTLQEFQIPHWVQDNGVDHFWNGRKPQKFIAGLGTYMRANNLWVPGASDEDYAEVLYYKPQKPLAVIARDVPISLLNVLKGLETSEMNVFVAHEYAGPDSELCMEVFFLDQEANKETAFLKACDSIGVDIQNTMMTGDGLNDVGLIQAAGVGVAMGNAVQEVKAVASYIAPPQRDDGARIALDALVLRR